MQAVGPYARDSMVCRNNNMVKRIIGLWRMPRSCKAMKDVISCDKLGGEANIL